MEHDNQADVSQNFTTNELEKDKLSAVSKQLQNPKLRGSFSNITEGEHFFV